MTINIWEKKYDGEILDLTGELFETTPGLSWDDANRLAVALVPGLLALAAEWDAQAQDEAEDALTDAKLAAFEDAFGGE